MKDLKTFYIVTGLTKSGTNYPIGERNRYETEKEAVQVATNLVENRRASNAAEIDFYVLKMVAVVGVVRAPIKVTKPKR